jgi:hypothetical protein
MEMFLIAKRGFKFEVLKEEADENKTEWNVAKIWRK